MNDIYGNDILRFKLTAHRSAYTPERPPSSLNRALVSQEIIGRRLSYIHTASGPTDFVQLMTQVGCGKAYVQ